MNRKLFVGNLSYNTQERTLEELFAQAGTVASVRVMRDKATGRARGFGFVEMETEEAATAAIDKFNNSELDGRRIAVNEARPQVGGGRRFRGGGNGRGGRGGDRAAVAGSAAGAAKRAGNVTRCARNKGAGPRTRALFFFAAATAARPAARATDAAAPGTGAATASAVPLTHHVFHRRALGWTIAVNRALATRRLLGAERALGEPKGGVLLKSPASVAQVAAPRAMLCLAVNMHHRRDRFAVPFEIWREFAATPIVGRHRPSPKARSIPRTCEQVRASRRNLNENAATARLSAQCSAKNRPG